MLAPTGIAGSTFLSGVEAAENSQGVDCQMSIGASAF